MPLATAHAMSRNCPPARHEAVQSQERFFIMETDDDTPPAATAEPRNSYLEEKAFKSRTLLIFGSITDSVAADVTRRLIALDADSADKPIDILVSSPGGHLESGDAIHDIVRFISAPVNMIGTGWVGSAATHLYLAVPRERRVCLPNTRFLIHQPSGGAGGQATDIAIQAQEIIKARHRIAHEIARETGKPIDVVLADIERDRWLSAAEAVEYGLVSRIIQRKTELL
jgi:ATP-dependent Clp protease protease subunit